jgi:hypothetical protein
MLFSTVFGDAERHHRLQLSRARHGAHMAPPVQTNRKGGDDSMRI